MSTDQPADQPGQQPDQQPTDQPAQTPYYPTLNPVSAILLNGDDTTTATTTTTTSSSSPSSASSSGRGRVVALAAAGLVPILVGIAIWQFIAHSTSDPSQTVPSTLPSLPSDLPTELGSLPASPASPDGPQSPGTPRPVDALSPAGWTALVGAVRQQQGSTQVVQATVFSAYAVVGLPAKGGATAQYRWDGTGLSSFGTVPAIPGAGRIDMAAVKGTVVTRLSHRIRGMVTHPTAWYVLLRTDPVSRKPSLYVYANNDAGHGGYLLANPAGVVQRTVTW